MRKSAKSPAAQNHEAPVRPGTASHAAAEKPTALKIAIVLGEDERRGPGLHITGMLYEFPDGQIARVPRTKLRGNGKIIDDIDVAHYVTINKEDIQSEGGKAWIGKQSVRSSFLALEKERKAILERGVKYSPDVDLTFQGEGQFLKPSVG